MNRFRQFINETELQELYLKGRLYTWSNERDTPTLEHLDHVFTSDECMRFRFEIFWPKCEGYLQIVEEAWNAPLPWSAPDVDAFRYLDFKHS